MYDAHEQAREMVADLRPTVRSADRRAYDLEISTTRVIAHCALASDADTIRGQVTDHVTLDDARAMLRAALDCIALAFPCGGRSSEESLTMIRWKLAQAIRPHVEALTHDALGDYLPEWEQFAEEPYSREDA